MVFVGGAAISLYPDRPVLEVRPTDDVDVIVEILNYKDRAALEEKLRSIGFTHDTASGIICRYCIQGIIVDIMPTADPSIGFTNRWYSDGFNSAVDHVIDETCTVKILTGPYFIDTKMEAFKGRGQNDGRTSHDFEDIVYVLENRQTIWNEINSSDKNVREYLRSEFTNLLINPNVFEWIDGHVERGSPPATYTIMEDLGRFTASRT
ncbi:MAG: hypothetical protein JWO92_1211 [Chitinophagaceae bacterium]|nr:hypothetical protein [Chitinophagaceae bacterium]